MNTSDSLQEAILTEIGPRPIKKDIRSHAADVVECFEELINELHDIRDKATKKPSPILSERVFALLTDAQSLAKGISTGAIQLSQPRIASNMLQCIAILEESGHFEMAGNLTSVIGWVSSTGLAAENCQFSRGRGSSAV